MRLGAALAAAMVAIGLAAGWAGVRLAAHVRITTTITWDREIAPLLSARCAACHTDGGPTPMSLTTYESARPWARAIRYEVVTRRMPKWHAARGFGDFANDPSLSPYEIALVAAWVDGGAPRALPARPGSPAASTPPAPAFPAVIATMKPVPPAVPRGREIAVACGDRALPPGRLIGLRPKLPPGGSVRVVAVLPDSRREVLGWFRDFDPGFAPTYWLRSPIEVPPGARIFSTSASTGCRIVLTLDQGRRERP
jgi:mono/diheme cytochrome c family protein